LLLIRDEIFISDEVDRVPIFNTMVLD